MILFEDMKKSASIDTLYNYAKSNGITLFPTEDFDFWAGYDTAYQKFDRYFYQKYRAFKVMQDYTADASDADMLADFKAIIDAHFLLNAKRYSELYRVQVLAADAYDVVNNYDLNETITRKNTGTVEDARGARTDSATRGAGSTQTVYGAKNAQTAYGAENEQTAYGATSEQTAHGAETEQTSYGAKNSSNSTNLGAQTSQSTQSRSAFNASQLVEVQGGNISNGARSDSATLTEQAHTDTKTRAGRSDTVTRQAHTDTTTRAGRTDSVTEQTHTDTTTEAARTDGATIGAQTNTRTDDLEENTTIRRYGNIGVQTPADVIGGHIDLWQAFKFYQMIFDEIAAEYLVIDVDFDFCMSCVSDATLLYALSDLIGG